MKVIYTEQAYDSLNVLSQFLVDELEWYSEKLY